ncbi:Replication factor A protein 3 [Trinorchestia longiramus]|nr:Replication factor A protein 3 [Trinorchestia longiramus]
MRVNGSLLPQFNGKGVVVLGKVLNVDPNGMSVTLRTSDGKTINLVFNQPLMENLEGIVEVHGTCSGSQVHCESYYMLPIDTIENFDMDAYDQAVQLIHSTENAWIVH